MHGVQHGPQFDTTATVDDAFAFLADKLPVEDLTAAALADELAPGATGGLPTSVFSMDQLPIPMQFAVQ